MSLISWNPAQQSALQLLGYKRFVLRRELLAHQEQEHQRHHLPKAEPQLSQSALKENAFVAHRAVSQSPPTQAPSPHLTQAEKPPSTSKLEENQPQTLVVTAGTITLSQAYTLLQSEALAFDWLLPPLTGFIGQLCFFRHKSESALLLQGLRRVGLHEEAQELATLLEASLPHTLPPHTKPPELNPSKTLVLLGQSAWRYHQAHIASQSSKSVHYLPHPHHAQSEGSAKKALWISFNQLRELL
ncbi:MAG: hypothetical protein Q4B71_07330 [Cardiobacteriaceae bacterium]|nr:hypothetical protein [Cardiobacteriaceae bacterium]